MLTIMLVEDNKINQKLGEKMLRSFGHHVVIANDGQEAIDLLIEHDEAIDLTDGAAAPVIVEEMGDVDAADEIAQAYLLVKDVDVLDICHWSGGEVRCRMTKSVDAIKASSNAEDDW